MKREWREVDSAVIYSHEAWRALLLTSAKNHVASLWIWQFSPENLTENLEHFGVQIKVMLEARYKLIDPSSSASSSASSSTSAKPNS